MAQRSPFRILAISLFLLATSSLQAAPLPNIILITLDTTRADRVGFLGSTRGLTPNLDAMARQSVVFTRAYAQVPLTTPSHAALLSGTYPQFNHIGDLGVPLSGDLPYLPDLLKHRGYKTAAFVGALILDPNGRGAPGFERGFDTFDAGFHPPAAGEDRYHSLERRAGDVIHRASTWLSKHPQGPFFIWIHLYDPHDPYDPPAPYDAKYKDAPYDGEIAYTDAMVGQFITALKNRGLYHGALIVVAADHGEAFGEHGELRHGMFLYDETVHVPLLFKLPMERSAGKRLDTRVGLVDVAPTLLREAGLPVPEKMQGMSLADQTRASSNRVRSDVQPDDSRSIYSETDYAHRSFGWSMVRSWRTSKYLYVQSPKRELYDQTIDLAAQHNLAENSQAVADTLNTQLDEFREKTSSAPGEQMKYDPVQAANLRALGYLASDNAAKPATGAPEIDPKDKIEIANALHQALVDMEEEHYDLAIPRLQHVIQEDPELWSAYLELGQALVHQKQYPQALPLLRRAAEKMPDSAAAHYELGFAMVKTGDWQGAEPQLQAALASAPDSPEMHFYLAAIYEQNQKMPQAIQEYRDTVRLSPSHFKANLMLGRIYGMQHNPAAALPFLEEAVRLDPNSPDAHHFLGNVYSDLGQTEQATRERVKVAILKAQRSGQAGEATPEVQ
jgi:arylsulfatase A-like enzyme/cytochrome c-type biogenesis protein CcmH/NrfG